MAVPTPSDTVPALYSSISEIETPSVLIDLEAMERNLSDYVSFADQHDIRLRSHVKTHKVPALARLQDQASGGGVVCQTLSEAEVMAMSGIDDIYLSYFVVEDSKLDRLVWLSDQVENFETTVDGPGNLEPLQAAAARRDAVINTVLEIDVGYGRVGVQPGPEVVDYARAIDKHPNTCFAGLMAYEGHIKTQAESKADFERLCTEAMDEVAEVVASIEDAGIAVPDVKVGSTSTSKFSGKHPIVTEINPGMYLFNDVGELTHRHFDVTKKDCALTVLTTVISTPTDNRIIIDAGSKSISMDSDRKPVPKDRDDIKYYQVSEEHGWLDTSKCDETFEVGDRIEFIVPHVCTTVNLHNTLVGVRDGYVESVWDVQARGKVK